MPIEDFGDVGWVLGHVAGPAAEPALLVYRLNPLGQEFPLGLVLLIVLAFHFQNQHRAVGQSDHEIRPVFPHRVSKGVENEERA